MTRKEIAALVLGVSLMATPMAMAGETGAKCGVGKCGGSKTKIEEQSKCGGDKSKTPNAKCGGDKAKAAEAKCGATKEKATDTKCGSKK